MDIHRRTKTYLKIRYDQGIPEWTQGLGKPAKAVGLGSALKPLVFERYFLRNRLRRNLIQRSVLVNAIICGVVF